MLFISFPTVINDIYFEYFWMCSQLSAIVLRSCLGPGPVCMTLPHNAAFPDFLLSIVSVGGWWYPGSSPRASRAQLRLSFPILRSLPLSLILSYATHPPTLSFHFIFSLSLYLSSRPPLLLSLRQSNVLPVKRLRSSLHILSHSQASSASSTNTQDLLTLAACLPLTCCSRHSIILIISLFFFYACMVSILAHLSLFYPSALLFFNLPVFLSLSPPSPSLASPLPSLAHQYSVFPLDCIYFVLFLTFTNQVEMVQ